MVGRLTIRSWQEVFWQAKLFVYKLFGPLWASRKVKAIGLAERGELLGQILVQRTLDCIGYKCSNVWKELRQEDEYETKAWKLCERGSEL